MRAVVIKEFGGPEVFEEREVSTPRPQANEVLVKVYATSINPVDYKIRQSGTWAGITPPAIIGYDVSGVVEAVGADVKDFRVGDEVYYTPEIFGRQGSYAEYHVENEAVVARKPTQLSHVEAASIPLAGGTAWDAIVTRTNVQAGETVLIHGGSGGVGSFAIQIAKAIGATVYAVASERNQEFMKSLGADYVFNYKAEDYMQRILRQTNNVGVDVVFDTVGGDTLSKSIVVTKPFGRMVSIVNTTGDLNTAYGKNITLHFEFLQRARYKLDYLREFVEQGKIKTVIDSVFPLSQVAEAQKKLEQGGVRGKVAVQVV